ncbi:MAG: Pr6Pr family membrane protein [Clostridia bacterium]|nr:Pr6Pr family membrane protein [Clostridia bacterium]
MEKRKYLVNKNYTANYKYAILILIIGLVGVGIVVFQILSYDTLIKPFLYSGAIPFYPEYTTNYVGAWNLLSYFTIISNLLISIYFICFALSVFGIRPFKKLSLNPSITGAFALYIFVVGIVYCFVLVWFVKFYPWNSVQSVFNYTNIWQHMFVPLFMFYLLFKPFTNRKISNNAAFYYLIFPVIYYIVTMIRGWLIGFFPYAFLSPEHAWHYIGGGTPYNGTISILVVIAFFIFLLALFYLLGRMIILIHNNHVDHMFKHKADIDRRKREKLKKEKIKKEKIKKEIEKNKVEKIEKLKQTETKK